MIENGTAVKVHYKGTLDDGSVFDSSENRDALAFTIGAGQVIGGFDAAVRNMDVGTTKTVTIPCAERTVNITKIWCSPFPTASFLKL